jgi:hypothetical protein
MKLSAPYPQAETNLIYNLLFCDDLSLFQARKGEQLAPWQSLLFGQAPTANAVRALAEDQGEESRVRALAYSWLRQHQLTVAPRILLGVIVEVPLERGLDVLAAYQDGRVRYINQTGKIVIFEGAPPEVEAKVHELLAASQLAVDRSGPWDKPRRPPPSKENIRVSFVVSDGLYFGEGPFSVMEREPLSAPIVRRASELLRLVVDTAST